MCLVSMGNYNPTYHKKVKSWQNNGLTSLPEEMSQWYSGHLLMVMLAIQSCLPERGTEPQIASTLPFGVIDDDEN